MKKQNVYPYRKKKTASSPIKDIKKVHDMQDYLKEKSERDYILFIIGISTGYRAGDLVALQIRDIRTALEDGQFVILENKKKNCKNIRKSNMKPRKAPIIDNLDVALRKYIKDKKDYDYMFPSRKGEHNHIDVPRVTVILKEAASHFGLKKITAHSMRKTYAYQLWESSGYNTTLVKDMLGHESEHETRRYLGLDDDMFRECSKSLNKLVR